MITIKINQKDIKPENKLQVDLLRVMGAVESARVMHNLYEKVYKEDSDKHLFIVTLTYAIGSIACALETFKQFIESPQMKIESKIINEFKSEINFLYSYEVAVFQSRYLKRIRDKCIFHFDPEPAKNILEKVSSGKDNILLYEDPSGASTLAQYMIADWVTEGKLFDPKINTYYNTTMGKIFSSINKVLIEFIKTTFPNLIIENLK